MSPTLTVVLIVVAAYLLGGIPFGYLIGRLNGIDIRAHGSGNIGATNVLRTLGKKWGIFCFALDFLKGLLPVLAAEHLARRFAPASVEYTPLIVVFATVAGHIWTPYLRFKGGKGIATSAGAVMGVAPLPVLVALVAWGLTLGLTKYVGLASVVAAIALPVSAFALRFAGGRLGAPLTAPVLILLTVLGLLAVLRHKANIRRLLAGTEPKIGQKKPLPAVDLDPAKPL